MLCAKPIPPVTLTHYIVLMTRINITGLGTKHVVTRYTFPGLLPYETYFLYFLKDGECLCALGITSRKETE
jgi:hypothetical protein